jgi:hypothetical protein
MYLFILPDIIVRTEKARGTGEVEIMVKQGLGTIFDFRF